MLQVISQTDTTAMVVVHDPPVITSQTVHLRKVGITWRDRWGTPYSLHANGVDWSVFYRDRLLAALRSLRATEDGIYQLAVRMAHYVDKGPEPVDQVAA